MKLESKPPKKGTVDACSILLGCIVYGIVSVTLFKGILPFMVIVGTFYYLGRLYYNHYDKKFSKEERTQDAVGLAEPLESINKAFQSGEQSGRIITGLQDKTNDNNVTEPQIRNLQETQEVITQTKETVKCDKTSNNWKKAFGASMFVMIALVAGMALMLSHISKIKLQLAQKEEQIRNFEEQKEKEEAEKQQRVIQYRKDLNEVCGWITSAKENADRQCVKLIDVWNNSVYKIRNQETDEYTMRNGAFLEDFNDAIKALQEDLFYSIRDRSLKNSWVEITKKIKLLTNPPEEYQKAYEALFEYYVEFDKLYKMAVNPSGSLDSYSEQYKAVKSSLVDKTMIMRIYADF